RLHQIEFRGISTLLVARARSEGQMIALFLGVVLPASALLIYRLFHLARRSISLQELAEQRYRELAGDLEQRGLERTAELKQAHEQLARKERLALLGQLTGTVSHELRNPLSTLRLGVQGLGRLQQDGDPTLKRTIELIERSIDRCNHVVSELLDFS